VTARPNTTGKSKRFSLVLSGRSSGRLEIHDQDADARVPNRVDELGRGVAAVKLSELLGRPRTSISDRC